MAETRALNILIVHGIGWGGRGTGYPRPLMENLRHEFDQAIRKLHLRDAHHARAKDALRFEVVCWDPITQEPQDSFLEVMFGRRRLRSRFSLTTVFRRNMVALLGDVIAYEHGSSNRVYEAIHGEVHQCMMKLSESSASERDADGNAPLTIIGHSLGSVIASDYVWDHIQHQHGCPEQTHILSEHHLALINFIAMGSPMGLYALRNNAYGGRESIRHSLDCPIRVAPDNGLWLNLYDRQDAIAFPLEPIEAYQRTGVIDRTVNVGNWLTNWNIASHTGYWRNEEVARLVARKLALDWAALNSPRFAGHDYTKALDDLRKELRQK